MMKTLFLAAALVAVPWAGFKAAAGTLAGHVRDRNWYAVRDNNPAGVGYYEFAVNANGSNIATLGGFTATDVFGAFSMPGLTAGAYAVASWDVWWRSSFVFGVPVPATGSTPDVDLRLNATMWGYPAFWDSTGYFEFGQTFTASGPISMIFIRDPLEENFTRTVTVREGGPGGAQVGVTRTYGSGGDHRLIYGFGDLPTVKGQSYYLRIRSPSATQNTVITQMDPRPDFSDPMPGGHLWLGDGTTLTPHPDRDLGVVIMADDDGLITDLFARRGGATWDNMTSLGQTFVARGVNLISAAFWLADPSAPTYAVRLYQGNAAGPRVGTTKRGKPPRVGADPEMIVCWAPGECPLTPGQIYYIEVKKDDNSAFNVAYVNAFNPFPFGEAYRDGVAQSGTDVAGTLMEEASAGSASQPAVQFTAYPAVTEASRGSNTLIITWTTDVAADSLVEFAAENPPYTRSNYVASQVMPHALALTGLLANTLYHFRVTSTRPGYRDAVSRDLVICTKPELPNLLANPSFEEGSGPSPRNALPSWTETGTLDIRASDGTWFGGLPPRAGGWLLQGALNGGSSDAAVFQRVSGVTPGKHYTFSAWVTTWPIENGTWKYDVWDRSGRLIYMRLGIDPTGGTNAAAGTVHWTPRMYSHRRWNNLATSALAQATNLTVFVSMKGDGVEWHLYGVDDTVLTETTPVQAQPPPALVLALAEPGSNTFMLSFDAPVHPVTATNLANYLLLLNGTNALVVLGATVVNDTNVLLLTEAAMPRADYSVVVSNVVHLSSQPGAAVPNSQLPLRRPMELIAIDAATQWRYDQSGNNLGSGWRFRTYNDSAWASGAPLLAYEEANLPEPIRTPLSTNAGKITFYFRKRFTLPDGTTEAPLRLRQVIDDGVVYYLNGAELFRLGVTNNPVFHTNTAARTVADAVYEGPFTLWPPNLVSGTNLLAAEVHQSSATSSDVVFGALLEALVLPSQLPLPTAVLRIELRNGIVRLTWDEPGWTLESAPAPDGLWDPYVQQNSPVELDPGDVPAFFRLRQ